MMEITVEQILTEYDEQVASMTREMLMLRAQVKRLQTQLASSAQVIGAPGHEVAVEDEEVN